MTTTPPWRGSLAWAAMAALLAAAALLAWPIDQARLDWQPGLALQQPWRLWTAAAVHWSAGHLAANLAGTLVVAAFGASAGVGTRAALAWALAWPLTQAGLWLRPDLLHFGGLSGVLHGGVAIVAVHLLRHTSGRGRRAGLLVLAGLAIKLLSETPWGPPLQAQAGWRIAVAPWSHLSGTVAGLLATAVTASTGVSKTTHGLTEADT